MQKYLVSKFNLSFLSITYNFSSDVLKDKDSSDNFQSLYLPTQEFAATSKMIRLTSRVTFNITVTLLLLCFDKNTKSISLKSKISN